jgi:prephenate dehydratase
MKTAFQGDPGAYSEAAALEYFGNGTTTIPCNSFDEVFAAVESGLGESGIVPIENSLAGSIHRNYDLLFRHQLFIIGEHYLRIRHCLIALPGVAISDIRKVYSHPQGLAQCEGYIRSLPGVEPVASFDTAGSVRMIRDNHDLNAAAIASQRAANVYGMQTLAEGIEDDPANFTRFLILSKQPARTEGPTKTSVVFVVAHIPGSLYRALGSFAQESIDLTKIESRPLVGKPWEYLFYADFASPADTPAFQRAIERFREQTLMLRLLGSYSRGKLPMMAEDVNAG